MPADSDWGEDPERFFGHVTVKVDPGDDDYTPRPKSGNGGNNNDDDDDDNDSFSDVSGISDNDDEVPFGPSRDVGADIPSKSLEILRRVSYHGGDAQAGEHALLLLLALVRAWPWSALLWTCFVFLCTAFHCFCFVHD